MPAKNPDKGLDWEADIRLAWPILASMIESEWPAELIEALETWYEGYKGPPLTAEALAAVRRLDEAVRGRNQEQAARNE